MATRYSAKDIQKIADREFFFDTNVLFYLYYSTSDSKWQVKAYSGIFSELLKHKSALIIDSHVLSELINRILRIEHKNSSSSLDYKPYRDSINGQKMVKQTYNIAKLILKKFSISGNKLSTIDIENILTTDNLDFNDKLIEKHCLDNGYILVTNDKDFRATNVEILTANKIFGV